MHAAQRSIYRLSKYYSVVMIHDMCSNILLRNVEFFLLCSKIVIMFSEEECHKAYQMFNGRWYAQKQLSCEFCPVQKWRTAICGGSKH